MESSSLVSAFSITSLSFGSFICYVKHFVPDYLMNKSIPGQHSVIWSQTLTLVTPSPSYPTLFLTVLAMPLVLSVCQNGWKVSCTPWD